MGMEKDPIYELDGRISLQKAVPFGLQHVLAMFVANIAPILIVTGAVHLAPEETGSLVQTAMIIAGIGSLLQLFPLGPLGSGLPIIMGISFTFVSTFCVIGGKYGYGAVLGAALVGGILEGLIGMGARYWRRFVPPIVSASVVTAIGFSLLGIGASSFGAGLFSLPHPLPYSLEFRPDAIFSVFLIFLVSATETLGDTSALAAMGLNRAASDREIRGSIAVDGFISSLSSLFGCLPITSFSQNVGLVAMTHVVNRKAIASGACLMILAGLFPAFGVILASLPEAVLGGCTLMMFGSIVISGVRMLSSCGFTQRNMSIAALSLSIGIGFTQTPAIFKMFPEIIRSVFAENCVAVVFVAAFLLNLVFPGELEIQKIQKEA